MSRVEITIAGLGGQGSILAGVIIGKAAVIYDGKFAVQTQAYSSELRGGFAAAWVVVDDNPVVFPRVTRPDVLIAQAQDSINRFAHTLAPEGMLIYDSDMVQNIPDSVVKNRFGVAATSSAREKFGSPVVANMILLGLFSRVKPILSSEALEKAIRESVPPRKTEVNLEAFRYGSSLA
ncbi:2-oxoacid:acceptor oxidoreductase family protein [Thermodesulforhabdus norvegica]|uniref:2-oxoglutarate ferredoxin oxidoreductase, gamma subunit n=1 Tax=Thermodesulforhabdus norvegica TaxID=39841 RepID=A0A1I4R4G3_9BACT|nr:2-oxoacid:acceptor oxidoreductase family protein [Thermodesulforhabdus norvegica]SFM46813.1 2-oxoglutarate ferredoxin oxidoreductase, gamma subunit [Thermodesulforhabdus norvegica]